MRTTETALLFLRHPESDWNSLGIAQGQADRGLSDRGRRQLLRLLRAAPALGDVSAVYSSDLVRALQPAEELARALGAHGVSITPDLRERRLGKLEGTSWTKINASISLDPDRASGRSSLVFPESDYDLRMRVGSCLERVVHDAPAGLTLIVTHGDVIRAALSWALGIPELLRVKIRLDNARYTKVTRVSEARDPVWQLDFLNSVDPRA
jgi:probable phosphoglycerate mutase